MEKKFCPMSFNQAITTDKKCIEEKCAWWSITHSPSINDGECAILNIANGLIELKYKE